VKKYIISFGKSKLKIILCLVSFSCIYVIVYSVLVHYITIFYIQLVLLHAYAIGKSGANQDGKATMLRSYVHDGVWRMKYGKAIYALRLWRIRFSKPAW